jgi:hypothetical protein
MAIVSQRRGARPFARRLGAFLALQVLGTIGCSSGHAGKDPPKPVQECLDYERALEACFHRHVSIASQTALVPKSDDDRRRITDLCIENRQRLQAACR